MLITEHKTLCSRRPVVPQTAPESDPKVHKFSSDIGIVLVKLSFPVVKARSNPPLAFSGDHNGVATHPQIAAGPPNHHHTNMINS